MPQNTAAGLSEGRAAIPDAHPAAEEGGVADDLPTAQYRTAPEDVRPASAVVGGVAGHLPAAQRRAALVDVHPATVGGRVAVNPAVIHVQRRAALADVHPAAVGAGGVAEDLPPVQCNAARPDVHPAAVVAGLVADDDGVDQRQVGIAAVDAATTASDVAAGDAQSLNRGADRPADVEHPPLPQRVQRRRVRRRVGHSPVGDSVTAP